MPRPTRPFPKRILRRAGRGLRTRAGRALSGFVNGVDWLTREPTDLVDRTPFDEVLREGKLTVRRYRPLDAADELELGTETLRWEVPRLPIPVLLVPPLMVRPFIFDLAPERSFVRTLLGAGFDVFLVDFGEPDRRDEEVRLDRYVLDWMPAAVDAVLEASGAPGLSLVGYCMGGLFGLMHVAVHGDARVRGLVNIGSPVDFHEMGILAFVVRHAGDQIEYLAHRIGNVPGRLSSAGFRLLAPMKNVTRYADLFLNLWDDEYVDGFDALTAWTSNFIDYPAEAFRQFVHDFLRENKLKDGRLVFGGRVADLSRVKAPLLAFAGKTDQVAPVSAVRQVLDLVGSEDTELRVVPGGHMGVFAGRSAPERVWRPTVEWLTQRARRVPGDGAARAS